MTERLTDVLRERNAETWDAAVGHRFVRELFDGDVDDAVMAAYLTQDYRFFDAFLGLLGAAVAASDDADARLTFAGIVGEVAGDENTYFMRAFGRLGVTDRVRRELPDAEPTTGFIALMREAAESRDYAAILTVLVVAEWLYLDWGRKAPKPLPEDFLYAEWITLHNEPGFHARVDFLRSELDRVGPGHRAVTEDFFARAVRLELAFFESAYEHPLVTAR